MAMGLWSVIKLDWWPRGILKELVQISPVVNMVTVRALLAIVAARSWLLFHMNVNNAFLQGDLDEEVFMDIYMRDLINLEFNQVMDERFVNC